ncbi:MAG: hypothetical protein U0V18_18285 [Anaerolineales bacterium]
MGPEETIYFFIFNLIIGGIAGWRVNLIEKNQTGTAGGKAGFIVVAISGISHQILLPVFLGLTTQFSFGINDFLYMLGEEGFAYNFIYLLPAMIGGYISGYFAASHKPN